MCIMFKMVNIEVHINSRVDISYPYMDLEVNCFFPFVIKIVLEDLIIIIILGDE